LSLSGRHYLHHYSKDTGAVAKHEADQRYLKNYLRCAKGVDDNLGRLFDSLKKRRLVG